MLSVGRVGLELGQSLAFFKRSSMIRRAWRCCLVSQSWCHPRNGQLFAERLFTDAELEFRSSRRDVLNVGLLLAGVSTALGSVPALIQVVGTAVWYLEGSRQALFWPSMERSWESLANHSVTFMVGAVPAARAGRIASALDSRGSRKTACERQIRSGRRLTASWFGRQHACGCPKIFFPNCLEGSCLGQRTLQDSRSASILQEPSPSRRRCQSSSKQQ